MCIRDRYEDSVSGRISDERFTELSAVIFVIINGRMVEIYLMVSLAPVSYTHLAVGIDKVTKDEYGKNLDRNIKELVQRLKNKSFKPLPSLRVYTVSYTHLDVYKRQVLETIMTF